MLRSFEITFLVLLVIQTSVVTTKRRFEIDYKFNLGYDFEVKSEMDQIRTKTGRVEFDNNIHKNGNQSLKWVIGNGDALTFDLTAQYMSLKGRKPCGIYLWIHQKEAIDLQLLVTLFGHNGTTYSFRLNMNFKNWKAVARLFPTPTFHFEEMEISVSSKMIPLNHQINFDLLRLTSWCFGWSYDFVNPPQIILPEEKLNECGGRQNLYGIYDASKFWQGLYKWRKVDLFQSQFIDGDTKLDNEERKLLKELKLIEKRVDEWFYPAENDKNESSLDQTALLKLQSLMFCDLALHSNRSLKHQNYINSLKKANSPYIRPIFYKSKDVEHEVCFATAYKKLSELPSLKSGSLPSLFPSRDVFPSADNTSIGLKFNEIIHRILFPLSLQYFISKRSKYMRKKKQQGEITLQTLIDLFDYLYSEGWDDGSGLGNTDHLFNVNAGFVHAVYFLRKELSNKSVFQRLVRTARWYSEIGEIHQDSFTYAGSTADKVKGTMLSRLLLILASPSGTVREARQKIMDAKKLKLWIENALKINEGYGGIFKPDFVGYHHKGVYVGAYVPMALQVASLIVYLLQETSLAISTTIVNNLKNALFSIVAMSSKHEIPFSVAGAKLGTAPAKLNQLIPSYAYLAMSSLEGKDDIDLLSAEIFIRLYQKDDVYVMNDLLEGKLVEQSQYVNTIGSIAVLERAYSLVRDKNIKPALAPYGNWAKNYAGLMVHRRKNWVAVVKGFSKYIWDYESFIDQNNFGRYLSHGSLQITNGPSSLHAYDLFNGWDWNKFPGTTVVNLRINELKSTSKCRYFTNRTMVGGLTFDRRETKNGIFVMDFQQPAYLDKFFVKNKYSFNFRKSFFFYDDIIVCLGSNIESSLENRHVITTLFQNRLHKEKSVRINDFVFDKRDRVDMNFSKTNQPITILDANGNGYFVPFKYGNLVEFNIARNRNSYYPNGKKITSPKVYASAIFNHGSTPLNSSYEFAIIVDGGKARLLNFKSEKTSSHPPYFVLRQDEVAHIVEFTGDRAIVHGYTVFDENKFKDSGNFLRAVSRPCLVMIKENVSNLATLSVSDPDLRLFENYVSSLRGIGVEKLYNIKSKPALLKLTFNRNFKVQRVRNSIKRLRKSVRKILDTSGEVSIELLLSHGFTTEIDLLLLL